MYLGALSLRLDFLHYEEACIQESFNAVDQAGLFTTREPRRGCTSDAFVPAHTSKGVDRLLDSRLRLLTLKESLELFLCGVVKTVGHG